MGRRDRGNSCCAMGCVLLVLGCSLGCLLLTLLMAAGGGR